MAPDGRVLNGIATERRKLKDVRERADHIINTTKLSARELTEEINNIYGEENQMETKLMITVLSFGFKYGIPMDSDLVFDVRFLPNPYYIPELKQYSGNDKPVRDYVLDFEGTKVFIDKLQDMLEFLIPNYKKEGKDSLLFL